MRGDLFRTLAAGRNPVDPFVDGHAAFGPERHSETLFQVEGRTLGLQRLFDAHYPDHIYHHDYWNAGFFL